MRLRYVMWILAMSIGVVFAPMSEADTITITKMSWVDVASKLVLTPSADTILVDSGGGYMEDALKIISFIEGRKVICTGRCVSAAAFVVVCSHWDNQGELWLHLTSSEDMNNWLYDHCDLPDLSLTTKDMFWYVEGNDLDKGYLRKWGE